MRTIVIVLCLTGIAGQRIAPMSGFDAAVAAEWQGPTINDPQCKGAWAPHIYPKDYNGNGTFTCRDGVWVPDFAKVSKRDLAVARVTARHEAARWVEREVTVREGKQVLPFGPQGALVDVECAVVDWSGLEREPGVQYILSSHSCGYQHGEEMLLSWMANVPYTTTVRVLKTAK